MVCKSVETLAAECQDTAADQLHAATAMFCRAKNEVLGLKGEKRGHTYW